MCKKFKQGKLHRAITRLTYTCTMDEVGEPLDPEQVGLLAHHKADGVHEVRLAGAVGSDDRHEGLDGPDLLVAPVRLEVVHLNKDSNGAESSARTHLNKLELDILESGRHGGGGRVARAKYSRGSAMV